MPTKFNLSQDPISAPGVTAEKPVYDVSNMINNAGVAATNLGKMFVNDKSEEQLGTFSGILADVENQYIAYEQETQAIKVQLATEADDRVRKDLQDKLLKAQQGKTQGLLSSTQARIMANNYVKEFSVNYPHLAKQVRAMANESMDNIREVINEVEHEDPQAKAVAALTEQAFKNGVTVTEQIRSNKAAADYEVQLHRLTMLEKTGEFDANQAIAVVQDGAYNEVLLRARDITTGWRAALEGGENFGEADITQVISSAKDAMMRKYHQDLIGRNLPALSTEQMKNALAPSFLILDNMETAMKAKGTREEKLKFLKDNYEIRKLESEDDMKNRIRQLGGFFDYLSDSSDLKVIATAASILSNKKFKLDDPSWDAYVQASMADSPEMGLALKWVRTNEGQKFLGENLAIYVSGSAYELPGNNNLTHAATVRNIDAMIAQMASGAEVTGLVEASMPRFTWADIKGNSNLKQAIQGNPVFTQEALRKAAHSTKGFLGSHGVKPESIVIDHSKMGNVFSVKGSEKETNPNFTGTTVSGVSPQKYLNDTYMEILNTFGAEGVDTWLEQLGLKDLPKKAMPSESKKKVSEPNVAQYNKPTPYDPVIEQAANASGVDPKIFKLLLGSESSFSPTAVSPRGKDYGLGFGQINSGWGLSDEERLNPQVAIPAAAGILSQYLRASGGDYKEALMKYKGASSQQGRASMEPVINAILREANAG